jgi:hypothetical protein
MRAAGRCRVVVVAAVLAACTGCTGSAGEGDDAGEAATSTTTAPAVVADLEVPDADHCDPLDPAHCLLPFPSSRFEAPDDGADTGVRLAIPEAAMPANAGGTPVDPAAWAGNDGWSPSTPILAVVPGVDLEASGAAPVTDVAASLDEDAPIVLVDADTGERWPYWAEVDVATAGTATPVVTVHPAVALAEGHRFVVGLRGLVDGDGEAIAPGEVFAAYRDGTATDVPEVEDRRPAMEEVFAALADAGVERDDLSLAWDFTVASARNLSERLLHMRDDALASFGDGGAPPFTVTAVEPAPGPGVARRVTGTFDVPLYLDGDGASGSRMVLGDDGLPERQGDYPARFVCLVPDAALAAPGQPVVYGHGLLGSAEEVDSYGELADEGDLVLCATDWIGMSGEDLGTVAGILADLSRFPTLADRTQQGILNTVVLGRLLNSEDGLASDPAFLGDDGRPVLRVGDTAFDGNSQGGIMGGAATAVSTEWTRAVLGVPGMGYATLLPRSVDWDPFSDLLDDAYPDPLDRAVGLGLIQVLWDRGESSAYARHMTDDPYEGTPAHDVLLVEAFGDHQVANVGTEVMARTIGAAVRQPALADGRSTDDEPFWGIEAVPSFPYDGSALVVWDFGTPAPPTGPEPPRPPEYGEDPHGMARGEPRAVEQVLAFLAPDGALVEVCGDDPCRSEP